MSIGNKSSSGSAWMFMVCGLWLIGLGMYFIFFRPSFLPEDARFIGATLLEIRTNLPGIERWLSNVFTVMGGFMAGTGVLTLYIARVALPSRLRGTALAIAGCGALTVALMSVVNFTIGSDFKWLLLIPMLFWLSGLIFYLRGR